MLMRTDNRGVDHLHGGVMGGSQRIGDFNPDAGPSPANEAIVAGRVWTIFVREVSPRRPGPQYPKDAVEDTAVVHPWNATRLVRQHPKGKLSRVARLGTYMELMRY